MKILNWKFQLNSANLEFDSYPTCAKDNHTFYCRTCDLKFIARLDYVLKHRQCPNCKEIVTYLIYFPSLDLYKVGVSTDFYFRSKSFGAISEVILTIKHDTIESAKVLEKQWLSNLEDYLCNMEVLPSGNTETFKI